MKAADIDMVAVLVLSFLYGEISLKKFGDLIFVKGNSTMH